MIVFVDLRPWNSVLCGREISFAVYEGYLGFNVLVLVLAASLVVLLSFLEVCWLATFLMIGLLLNDPSSAEVLVFFGGRVWHLCCWRAS